MFSCRGTHEYSVFKPRSSASLLPQIQCILHLVLIDRHERLTADANMY